MSKIGFGCAVAICVIQLAASLICLNKEDERSGIIASLITLFLSSVGLMYLTGAFA